jgi:hypothetical protein
MPPLAQFFSDQVDSALELAEAGERIRASAPVRSTAFTLLHPPRLGLLYEMAFLRVAILWETFLEDVFVRLLCGYVTFAVAPVLRQPPCPTIHAAQLLILGGQDYVSWSPKPFLRRAQKLATNCNAGTVIASNQSRLEWLLAVRNRIAHGSSFAKTQFDSACMSLAGRRYRGASAGLFLRDMNLGVTPAQRWLQTVGGELKNIARQIAP